MKFVITPAARRDILVQYRFYAEERGVPEIAERFLDAVQNAIHVICRTPGMGTLKNFDNKNLSDLRSWSVRGFPAIRIYYVLRDDALRVVRVLHGKRDIDFSLDEE